MTYDHWKTTNPADEFLGPDPDEEDDSPEPVSECDCCGDQKEGCIDTVWNGMEVHACPFCRGVEPDWRDDRADYEYERWRDE
jgi:hypothetical protein